MCRLNQITALLLLFICVGPPPLPAKEPSDPSPNMTTPPPPGVNPQGRRIDGLPAIIAHRGASGIRPEHTHSAYQLALDAGSDVIEPDLVATKDQHLVCLHDLTLNRTTDIADKPEFAKRAKPNKNGPQWLVTDFTLAELKTLRVRQGRPGRSTNFDGQESIPTFHELVRRVREHNAKHQVKVGLSIELKSPSQHRADGIDLLAIFLREIHRLELLDQSDLPYNVQCFEYSTLQSLRQLQPQIPLAFLSSKLPEDLKKLRGQVDVLSVSKENLSEENFTNWLESAHSLGFGVHLWTFRNDDRGATVKSTNQKLTRAFDLGVDAIFTDHPHTAIELRNHWHQSKTERQP